MWGLPYFLGNRLTDGVEVVTITSRLDSLYLAGRSLVVISVRDGVDLRAIVWREGLGKLQNQMSSSEIEPATSQLLE
jgi:hypothetical protein